MKNRKNMAAHARIVMIITVLAALPVLTGCKSIVISAGDASKKINECMDNITPADMDKKSTLLNDVWIKLSNGDEDGLRMCAKYYGGPDEAVVLEADFEENNTVRRMDMLIRYEDILRDNVPDRVYINIASNAKKGSELFVGNISDTVVSLLSMYSVDKDTALEFLRDFKSRKVRIADGELGNMKWEYMSTAILPVGYHDYVLILTKK